MGIPCPNHFHALLRIHFAPTNREHHLGFLMSRVQGLAEVHSREPGELVGDLSPNGMLAQMLKGLGRLGDLAKPGAGG